MASWAQASLNRTSAGRQTQAMLSVACIPFLWAQAILGAQPRGAGASCCPGSSSALFDRLFVLLHSSHTRCTSPLAEGICTKNARKEVSHTDDIPASDKLLMVLGWMMRMAFRRIAAIVTCDDVTCNL